VLTELDVLRDVDSRLETAGIAYMLTGSMAMTFYTQPRMTRDLDIVIELREREIDRFVSLFAQDYYVVAEAVGDAVRRGSMFNVIHNEAVIKVDCIVRKHSEYRALEFARRQRLTISNLALWVVRKEDLIISKLDWAKDSLSAMQLRDVKTLLSTGADHVHLNEWILKLNLEHVWQELQK
jgi:hypothetical protein